MTEKIEELRMLAGKAREYEDNYVQSALRGTSSADLQRRAIAAWAKFDTALAAVGEEMERMREVEGMIGEILSALRPFAFLRYPRHFLSVDGGCSTPVVEDADVQRARSILSRLALHRDQP